MLTTTVISRFMTFRLIIRTLFFLLVFCVSTVQAKTVHLSWEPSPSASVDGYKVYYKSGSADMPLEGVELQEGISPIDVGYALDATFTLPDDGQVYYFATTAYTESGLESSYSNIVASHWIPAAITPHNGEINVPVSTKLIWTESPVNSETVYTIHISTDPSFPDNNLYLGFITPKMSGPSILLLLILMGFIVFRNKRLVPALLCCTMVLSIAACGGSDVGDYSAAISDAGGSSSTTTPDSTTPAETYPDSTTQAESNPDSVPAPVVTMIYSDLSADYIEYPDLKPNTTYYWKIVAWDGSEEVESLTYSFTTAQQ